MGQDSLCGNGIPNAPYVPLAISISVVIPHISIPFPLKSTYSSRGLCSLGGGSLEPLLDYGPRTFGADDIKVGSADFNYTLSTDRSSGVCGSGIGLRRFDGSLDTLKDEA